MGFHPARSLMHADAITTYPRTERQILWFHLLADSSSSYPRGAVTCLTLYMFVSRDGNTIELGFEDTKLLNQAIVTRWLPWLGGCPTHWTADGWLVSICIIGITSRYGQNRRICHAETEELETRQWLEERQWANIRFITIAIATDITLVLHIYHCRPLLTSLWQCT